MKEEGRMTDYQHNLLGSLLASFIQRKRYHQRVKNEIQRKEIFKEIFSTEKLYNEQLLSIIELFLRPMKLLAKEDMESSKWGITESIIHSIFSHIESIYSLSTILFDKINPRYHNWRPSQSIADIFVEMGPFLKTYKQFSENYTTSIETLKSLRQNNTQMATWLKNTEKDIRCRSLDLASLLIAPIQRVPRYILLLEALHRVTPSYHPDHKQSEIASSLLKSIVQVVNDGIHEDINRKKLIQLQATFDLHMKLGFGALSYPNLVEPHRKLIKEGKLQKKSMRNQSIQNRLVYLCNDLFITVTPLPKPIQSASINKIDKIIPLVTATIIFDSEDELSFYLISPIKTHKFICQSSIARAQWLIDIQTTILNLIESNPLMKQQRDQWSIEYVGGKWKAVSEIPKIDQGVQNIQSSLESFYHEPCQKNSSYFANNNNYNNNNKPSTTNATTTTTTKKDIKSSVDTDLNNSMDSSSDQDWVFGVPISSKRGTISSSFLARSPRLSSSQHDDVGDEEEEEEDEEDDNDYDAHHTNNVDDQSYM